MQRGLIVAVVVACGVASAQARVEPKSGLESKDYTWNAKTGEKVDALKKKGDPRRGEEAYEVCSPCHLISGAGLPDGTFPQLAGQHATVLIKQIADVRGGLRDNPVMLPFANQLTDPQELADVAAYIQSMKVPRDNGRGPGTNLALGKQLYEKACATCHMKHGEGDAARFFPVVAGQHYKYLLRQATEIRDGKRRNANPEMVKVIHPFRDEEVDAIVDYMSRLQVPEKKR